MRLLDFRAKGYRNLRNFPVLFTLNPEEQPESGCHIRFLIGLNGTGKSNILRFLTSIFAAISERYQASSRDNPAYYSPFRLSYELRDRQIIIQSQGRGRSGVAFTIRPIKQDDTLDQGKPYEPGDIPSLDLLLPSTLLVYTSGDINAWRNLLEVPSSFLTEEEMEQEHIELPTELMFEDEQQPLASEGAKGIFEQNEATDTPDGTTQEYVSSKRLLGSGRIIIVEPSHMPLALLAAFISHYSEQLKVRDNDAATVEQDSQATSHFAATLEQVRISGLLGFSLQVTPSVAGHGSSSYQFLHHLGRNATTRLQDWGDRQLWVFDLEDLQEGQPLVSRLTAGKPEETLVWDDRFTLLRAFVELQDAGLLHQVNMIVAKQHPTDSEQRDRVLLVDSLSDGERAFLERMALFYLLREEEALFLLDEPETHFNDAWKRKLVDLIERTLHGTNSQVILTTHESITLTDAYPEEIILLGDYGQENVPVTLGAEPGELMRSLFGVERSVGERAIRKISAALEQAREQGDKSKLHELMDDVGPGYFRFKIAEELLDVPPDPKA